MTAAHFEASAGQREANDQGNRSDQRRCLV